VKVPFTWKVTGWFMVGWSAEFPTGEARPLRYFSEDLVAYRGESGELHVLSGHCRHLGAHIGHGGKVVGDCVECPFHGWRWGPDGTNRYIPYQPDRPNKALRLRVYPVREQYGCVFVWHQPDGKDPQWEMPDLFGKFPQFPTEPDAYYRPYPEFSRRTEREPVHPQIVAENGPDSAHFHYVHGATVTPVCLKWEAVDEEWRFLTGWPDARGDDPDKMALYIHSHFSGLGFAISAFEGSSNHRLIFACTPVEDGYSDMFYSIWWPRLDGDTSDVPPDSVRERVERQFLGTVWEDLDIWRYQEYVEHPSLSKVDAKPYMAMRKWATQFYEVPATPPGEVPASV
jgi:nitrite reductase/ring-hydroxylating ferredoxin subunit